MTGSPMRVSDQVSLWTPRAEVSSQVGENLSMQGANTYGERSWSGDPALAPARAAGTAGGRAVAGNALGNHAGYGVAQAIFHPMGNHREELWIDASEWSPSARIHRRAFVPIVP